ncbi:MAG: cyclophilin-like family protein [Candidatus Hodarchaeales archaeon]|jgi:hypothetical protein
MSIDTVTVRIYTTNDQFATLALDRHLGPRTVALIETTILDFTSQARMVKKTDEIDILLKIGRVGPEKSRKNVNKNEVAYWPQGNMLMLFRETKTTFNPVNVIGKVKNFGAFENLKSGVMVKLSIFSEE